MWSIQGKQAMITKLAVTKKWILAKTFYNYLQVKSFLIYIAHLAMGGNFIKRLGGTNKLDKLLLFIESRQPRRVALFIAYHGDTVPESNLRYVTSLQRCGFDIIYIINARLSEVSYSKLSGLGIFPIDRMNIGQDFGGWKDGILALDKINCLNRLDWLLICNDSVLYTGNSLISSFEEKFTERLLQSDPKSSNTIAININYDEDIHIQSFFVCMNNKVIKEKKFLRFWQTYKPLSNRYHAINKGEKRLTHTIMALGSRIEILYTTTDLLRQLRLLNNLNRQDLQILLPLNSYFLDKLLNKSKPDLLQIARLVSWLECYNQSHVFALLFSRFLCSPFLKKDLVKMGVFSIGQISLHLEISSFFSKSEQIELISFYASRGKHVSYSGSLYKSVKEGIPTLGPNYSKNQLMAP
jgi:hypothetical protein